MNKQCPKCKLNEREVNRSYCRPCKAALEANRRLLKGIVSRRKRNPKHIEQGKKECFKCNRVLSIDNFSDCKRGYAGKMAWCKKCCGKYAATDARRSMSDYTNKYRKGKGREAYLLQHRNHQQKRRASKQSGNDGTVTTKFMIDLYATEICHYCNKFVPKNKRTADHKIPIIKGGLHSITNLVMCCSRCNSSKKDKTEEEFLKCMKQK